MDILSYVKELVKTKNISVLWITHLFDEIDENDDISIIKNGEIIESGLAKDIVKKHNKENLVDTFNELTKALK